MSDRSQPTGGKRKRTSTESASPGASLGDWIRVSRMQQSMSQRELADRSGLSRSYLCDIERGRGAQPSVTTLDKLAAALGVSRMELLRAAGIIEPSPGQERSDRERRFAALFRDLSPKGKDAVERFARFTHAEEHRWVQSKLSDRKGASGEAVPSQPGPLLFDQSMGDGADGI
jgi:transcriptional regulator with XRE-family HTH domain